MVCCTQEVPESSIEVDITTPSDCEIVWTRDGRVGGTFTPSDSGHILEIDNLGSIFLDAEWYENCKDENQTWVFYYVQSFMSISPNPASNYIDVEVKNEEGWLSIAAPSAVNEKSYLDRWEIRSQDGNLQKKGEVGEYIKSFNIQIQNLKNGFYLLNFIKGKTNVTFSFLKM